MTPVPTAQDREVDLTALHESISRDRSPVACVIRWRYLAVLRRCAFAETQVREMLTGVVEEGQ